MLLGVARVPVGVILDALQRAGFFRRRVADHVRPRRHRKCDVDARAVRGIQGADRGGHRRSPVAALCAVARITQALHQLGPGRGDAIDAPAGRGRLGREAEPGQGRADDMEGVGRIAAVLGWIDQRLDHLVELDDRPRPAMCDDQRHGAGMRRAHVHEMDVEPVDFGDELREAIEQRFAASPIVRLGPIAADLLDPFARRALAPVADQLGLRPARPAQPRLQVVEHVVANSDTERGDAGAHGLSPRLGWRMPGAGGVSGGPAKHWAILIQCRACAPSTDRVVSATLRVCVTT